MGGSKTKNYWSKTNKKVAVPKKSSRVIVLSYTYVVKKKSNQDIFKYDSQFGSRPAKKRTEIVISCCRQRKLNLSYVK